MPELDGLELATLLRQQTQLPIVLVSGFSQEIGVFNKLPPGNLSYLQKPFAARSSSKPSTAYWRRAAQNNRAPRSSPRRNPERSCCQHEKAHPRGMGFSLNLVAA